MGRPPENSTETAPARNSWRWVHGVIALITALLLLCCVTGATYAWVGAAMLSDVGETPIEQTLPLLAVPVLPLTGYALISWNLEAYRRKSRLAFLSRLSAALSGGKFALVFLIGLLLFVAVWQV